jgi:hypothetical protein
MGLIIIANTCVHVVDSPTNLLAHWEKEPIQFILHLWFLAKCMAQSRKSCKLVGGVREGLNHSHSSVLSQKDFDLHLFCVIGWQLAAWILTAFQSFLSLGFHKEENQLQEMNYIQFVCKFCRTKISSTQKILLTRSDQIFLFRGHKA